MTRLNKPRYIISFFVVLLILSSCNSDNKSTSKTSNQTVHEIPVANDDFFQEIGQEIGLDFVHSIGADNMKNIVESVGGGAAFLDYDNDGFIDIYTCSGTWVEGFSKSEKPKKLPTRELVKTARRNKLNPRRCK